MKIVIYSVLRLVFVCLMFAMLRASGVTFTNWESWVALCCVVGIYACGLMLGKEAN